MIADTLAADWGWKRARLTPHHAGMNSRTWWVDHDGVRAVAKWVPADEGGHLRAGVAAARLAGSGGLATGAPLPTTDGRLWTGTGGGCLVLLSLVAGAELSGDDADDQERMGTTLAEAHRHTVGRRADGAWVHPWVDPAAAHFTIDEEVRVAVEAAVEAVTAIPSHLLTQGLGHGDPAPEAFLHDGSTTGLIDWGSAVNGPLLHDLASAAMYLGGLAAARPMLAAYDAAGGPVPATEVEAHAATFLRWRWAVQADYFAGRIATGDGTGPEDDRGNRQGFESARRRLLAGP